MTRTGISPPAGSARTPPAARSARTPAAALAGALAGARERLATDPGAWLLVVAGACWLLAHVPALAPLAIPAWVATGLALGLVRPWYGLLLTVVTVPFLSGAIEQMTGEPLRVVPIFGAAVRVLVDRFIVAPSYRRRTPRDPAWWVVAAALASAGLYALTALTAANLEGRDTVLLFGSLQWLLGGPIAMMAAWIAASHLVAGRDRTLTAVALGTTVVASALALLAWTGLPGVDLITFPRLVEGGRLGALGYPTPTAMGLATVLPLAVAAAYRIRRWLVVPVVVLVLLTIVLTWSRGPLVAVFVGAALATLASGRVDRRLAAAGMAAAAVALAGLVAVRYGTNVDAIVATINASLGSDGIRVSSWAAAVTIAASNPLLGGGWHALAHHAEFDQRNVVYSHSLILDALASGGLPLGIANAIVVLYSAWKTWVRRHTMAVYLIAAVVTFLVCGLWDIPQVRSYAAVMGGIVLGMAAGPLIARPGAEDAEEAQVPDEMQEADEDVGDEEEDPDEEPEAA